MPFKGSRFAGEVARIFAIYIHNPIFFERNCGFRPSKDEYISSINFHYFIDNPMSFFEHYDVERHRLDLPAMEPILYARSFRRSSRFFALAALAAASLSACAGPPRDVPPPAPVAPPPVVQSSCLPSFIDTGVASWYGEEFHMKATASGEPFDMNDLTAAHRWLPLNTIVRVTNLENGKSAVLRINDRGPYMRGRVLDVSRYAAQQLGMKRHGTAQVRIEVFDLGRHGATQELALTAVDQDATDDPFFNTGKTAAHFPRVGTLVERP